MKILIIGATGLLGSDLCHYLSGAESSELIGWARRIDEHKESLPGVQLEQIDITKQVSVSEGIRKHRPDAVVLTAAASDVDACEKDPAMAREINGKAVGYVGKACADTGALLVAIGSDYVFDGRSGRPYKETDPVGPVNLYGNSKLDGEKQALASCPNSIVVRVSGLFGEARANFVSGAINGFRNGEPVKVVTDQINSPSYTVDLAEGLVRLLDIYKNDREAVRKKVIPRVLHLANAGGGSRLEVAQYITALLGTPDTLIERTTWPQLNRPARRPANTELSSELFFSVTGFRPRPWRDAVHDFIQIFTLD